MISGNSTILQIAKDTYTGDTPTPATTMTRQIRFSSVSIDYVPNKAQEPVLTGNIGQSRYDTMGVHTEGSISTLARPDDLGFFLLMALGNEILEETDIHIYTPNKDELKSFTIKLDKGAGVYTYPGCMINSLSFSAQPEDYLSLDLDIVGYDESFTAGKLTAITPSIQKAFKFNQGKVKFANVEIADITSIGLTYNNNIENTIQTTSTGTHYKKGSPNTREITIDLECLYSSNSETMRQQYFKTDAIFSIELLFVSDEGDPYKLDIDIPACQITSCSVPISDGNAVKQSMSLAVVDMGSSDLIKMTLENDVTTTY